MNDDLYTARACLRLAAALYFAMLGAATVAAERQPAPVATSVAAVKATATAARLPVAVTTPASERTKQQTARQQVPRRAAERYPNDPHGIVLPDGSFAPFHTY